MLEQIGSQFKILREIGPHKNKSHEGENCSPVTRIEALVLRSSRPVCA